VTSEVELELERLEQTAEADADTTELFLVELLPTFMEDDDGDIIVPRRQLKKRRNPTAEENIVEEAASRTSRLGCHQREEAKGEPKFILEARSRSTWDTAGTQLWRAAFVLAEYIYSTPVCLVLL
jgi:Uma2 family endonuclease